MTPQDSLDNVADVGGYIKWNIYSLTIIILGIYKDPFS